MRVLVTGAAGFIGMHVAQALLARGDAVVGIDNLNAYYDPSLKLARLQQLEGHAHFSFKKLDIADPVAVRELMAAAAPEAIVHLAAQAGVRYSITHPHDYGQSNLVGFLNVLEGARAQRVQHLVYASSSSVYGGNQKLPFSEDDPVDAPVSLYAATKKANELMAHSYSHLYGLPCTGLRFFTVYGPWGRPDMAYWLFSRAILRGEPIKLFNHGQLSRDFTYIDDIVEGVVAVLDQAPVAGPGAAARVLNIGSHAPVALTDFVATLEKSLGRRAVVQHEPMQAGDVHATYADVSRLNTLMQRDLDATPLDVGLDRFVQWYLRHGDAAQALH